MKRGFSLTVNATRKPYFLGQNRGPDEEGIFTVGRAIRRIKVDRVRIEAPMKRGFSLNVYIHSQSIAAPSE